jgi:phosphatidate cytidylyltransferase
VLKYRLITGPILIAALLLLIAADQWMDGVELTGRVRDFFDGRSQPPPGLLLFALSLCVAPFAAFELSAMCRANGIRSRTWLTALAAVSGLVLSYAIPSDTPSMIAIPVLTTGLAAIFALSLVVFSRGETVEGVLASAGAVLVAMVYLGFMMGFLLALRREHSAWWIVGVILTTKSCDTGAYFTGRAFGRHKMIPWLSPGKTWEGLAGGVVTAVLVGLLLSLASRAWLGPNDHLSPAWGALCGLVFGVLGQLGDLTMSLFKRGGGLKDSSAILPGLGGVLDVLDSPLMVAPVAFWLLQSAR